MTDSVESVIAGRSSKTDENKRSFEALPWKDKEAKNKPFKNYQSGHPVRAFKTETDIYMYFVFYVRRHACRTF